MARAGSNGRIEWTMHRHEPQRDTGETFTEILQFHENGHILRNSYMGNRSIRGWKQWAIVPRRAMGTVADWLETTGYKHGEWK